MQTEKLKGELYRGVDYELWEDNSRYLFIGKDKGYAVTRVCFRELQRIPSQLIYNEYEMIDKNKAIGTLYDAGLPKELCDKLEEISVEYHD